MSIKLTEGALERILKDEKVFGPFVQILEIKPVSQPSGQTREKIRLTISDGLNTHGAYLATQCTKLFLDHTIQQFHIVRLREYCVSMFSNSKIIIIASVEPIQPFTEQIGHPVPLGTAPPPKAEPQAAAAAPPPMPPSPMKSTNRVISSPTKVFTEAASDSGVSITPIKSLHPYQNFWTIRARVTSKTPMKEFARKTGGSGKLFTVELIDQDGDEIRATGFTEVADKLFPIFEVGRVYLISKGDVKIANKKFTTIAHSFEITFTNATTVTPVDDASTAAIPVVHFSFVPIEQIATMNKDDLVDVLGVVTQASDLQTFTQKSTGRELTKRTLTILDNTTYSIELTLWGDKASSDSFDVGSIVAVRAARVGTFNGKSLSTSASSQVMVSPDIPEAKKLATWYEDHGKSSAVNAISEASSSMGEGHTREDNIKTIALVHAEQLGKDEKADFFSCVACITGIKHDKRISYTACQKCGGKATQSTDGQYYCVKCSSSTAEASEVFSLNMQIADSTGSMWVSCFRDAAAAIMNHRDAAELIRLKETNEVEYNMAFDDAANRWFLFRIRARQETYHEDLRIQYTVYSATPVDYAKECKRLLTIIDAYP